MRESVELRVDEHFAHKVFKKDEGRRLGDSVRIVVLEAQDPRLKEAGRLQRSLAAERDKAFFYGWKVRRRYTQAELASARCFHLSCSSVFEPSGEQCGTTYDDSTACTKCGSGAVQTSDLQLDLRKVPKGKQVARTIAGEWIVSQHLAGRMVDAGLTGFELRPVRHHARDGGDPMDPRHVPSGRELLSKAENAGAPHPTWRFWVWLNRPENEGLVSRARAEYVALKGGKSRKKGANLPVWHQLVVNSSEAEIVSPTRIGIDPFNEDPEGRCRCARGDLIGLNLLSEISVRASSVGSADLLCTHQYVGTRRGLLRPSRAILASPKFRKLIESEGIKNLEIEVAHLV